MPDSMIGAMLYVTKLVVVGINKIEYLQTLKLNCAKEAVKIVR